METAIDKKERLFELIKKQKALSLRQASNIWGDSIDFIKGMTQSDERYIVEGGFILLKGLGIERCMICAETLGEYNLSTDKKGFVNIKIPSEFLKGKRIKYSLLGEIRGHRKCYSEIDVFFRHEGLRCFDCSSFYGNWIDGDEVEEECSRLKYEVTGHRGVLAGDPICNLFNPDYFRLKEKEDKEALKEKWEIIKPEIEKRTQQGYQNLIKLLEKAHLISV